MPTIVYTQTGKKKNASVENHSEDPCASPRIAIAKSPQYVGVFPVLGPHMEANTNPEFDPGLMENTTRVLRGTHVTCSQVDL